MRAVDKRNAQQGSDWVGYLLGALLLIGAAVFVGFGIFLGSKRQLSSLELVLFGVVQFLLATAGAWVVGGKANKREASRLLKNTLDRTPS
ncbi:MAG: hypothetical protein ACYC6T_18300 [Thermoleophilia bacterium]